MYDLQICDMVTIARYLNVTLIVPELDKTSFWADPRCVLDSITVYVLAKALSIIIRVDSFSAPYFCDWDHPSMTVCCFFAAISKTYLIWIILLHP